MQAAQKEGDDSPNAATTEAWKKMLDDLKKFEKDQKAVIDTSADLAKKPKDQYDQNDDKKLKDLAAVEDKWEKFMNNAMADISKIAEQDQANASLLDELIQMKIELTMAKNAAGHRKSHRSCHAIGRKWLGIRQEPLTTHIER